MPWKKEIFFTNSSLFTLVTFILVILGRCTATLSGSKVAPEILPFPYTPLPLYELYGEEFTSSQMVCQFEFGIHKIVCKSRLLDVVQVVILQQSFES